MIKAGNTVNKIGGEGKKMKFQITQSLGPVENRCCETALISKLSPWLSVIESKFLTFWYELSETEEQSVMTSSGQEE